MTCTENTNAAVAWMPKSGPWGLCADIVAMDGVYAGIAAALAGPVDSRFGIALPNAFVSIGQA